MRQGYGTLVVIEFTNESHFVGGSRDRPSGESEYHGADTLPHYAVDILEIPSEVLGNT